MSRCAIDYLALFCVTSLLASGQLLFKHIGLQIRGQTLADAAAAVLAHPAIYAAVFLYGSATMLWIWLLGRVQLTQAYPWVAAGVIIVPVLSSVFFDEHTRPVFWLGAGLIMAGIILTQYGVVAK